MTADDLRPWIARLRESLGEPRFRIDGRPAYLVRFGRWIVLSPELEDELRPGKENGEWFVPADL